MRIGTVSGQWFCRRSWRLKIDFRENFVQIGKSHVCSHKLEVQEANFCLTQFDGIWNYFSWCRFTHGRNSRSWSLGSGYWSFTFLPPTNLRNPKKKCRETCCMTHHQENTTTPKRWLKFSTTILNYATSIIFLKREVFSICTMLYIFEDTDAVIKMIINETRRGLRLIGYLTESIWTPKIQFKICWHQKPTRWHANQIEFFTRWMESPSPSLQYVSIFSSASRSETMSKRMPQGTGEERIVAKSKPTLNFVSQTATSSLTAPSFECIQSSGDTQSTQS